MALWVLLACKDGGLQRKLTAQQIVDVIVQTQEASIDAQSITNSLKRAGTRIHRHREGNETTYEIMRPGREHVRSLGGANSVYALYFEPGKRYSAKRLFVREVMNELRGEVKVVDAYCGTRTLDILASLTVTSMSLLTRLENLPPHERGALTREIADFKTEHKNAAFRDYPSRDIHDRYILTDNKVILLGHSMKDLGAKESFCVVLNPGDSGDLCELVRSSFSAKWALSQVI